MRRLQLPCDSHRPHHNHSLLRDIHSAAGCSHAHSSAKPAAPVAQLPAHVYMHSA